MISLLSRYSLHTYVFLSLVLAATADGPGAPDDAAPTRAPHVCVVGAGISGAVVSHFLSRMAPAPAVTVFERADRVGGRVRSLRDACGDDPVEAGASIIAGDNLLMVSFAEQLGLLRRGSRLNGTVVLGLWDAERRDFVMQPSSRKLVSLVRMFSRYGWSLVRSRRFVRTLFKHYNEMYPIPPTRHWPDAHATPEQLFAATRLFNLSQLAFRSVAQTPPHNMSPRLFSEMIAAVTRVNYGQDPDNVHALAGAIALAGAADDLWSVKGGNVQVVEGLLRDSGADVRLSTRVDAIRRSTQPPHAYTLHFSSLDAGNAHGRQQQKQFCDAVVLAAPIELANVSLPADIDDVVHVGREFQLTVATFVRGDPNPEFFTTRGGDAPLPSSILSISGERFTSLGKQCDRPDGPPVWKVFSQRVLSADDIGQLFTEGATVIEQFPWLAYPKFRVPERFAPFDCDSVQHAFFYTSPLESAGSAMEMSCVAAANVAALVGERLGLRRTVDEEIDVKSDL